MLTDPEVAATRESPPATGPAARRRRAGRRVVGAVAKLGLVAGLAGFNAWWYLRDTRPLADLRTIDRWIGGDRPAPAEAELRERLRRAPHDVDARMALARALAAGGDMLGCARALEQVPYWSPHRAEALFRAAQAFLMVNRARDAEAALKGIMDADPLHPPDPGLYHDAGQELLKLYATEDRWEDAYPVIWQVFDRSAPPDRPLSLTLRIRCELERIAPAEREKVVSRYVAADPSDVEALRALANAELALRRRDEALRHIEECLRIRPDDPRVWRDYLAMLQSLGERESFRAAMARLPRSADEEPEVWIFRGREREHDGDLAGAASDYRRALELDPNRIAAHYRLATIEARLGNRTEAEAHRRRWDEIRQAQGRLRDVDARFRSALAAAGVDQPSTAAIDDLRAATRRLGSTCEALGWARAAAACRQVVADL